MQLTVDVDNGLVQEARLVGQYHTESEVVEAALKEYIARRQKGKEAAIALQMWVDELYGDQKPRDTADTLISERRQNAYS